MKTLALFDFDGTITTRDSLSEFLVFVCPNPIKRFYLKYVRTFFQTAGYQLGLLSSDQLKKARLTVFFNRKEYADLVAAGEEFSDKVLNGLVKKSAMDAIDEHLRNGDDVYIVSASLDIILNPWCDQNGLKLITNEIDKTINNYTGRDCNSEEKVTRIKKRIDLSTYNMIYAYGDSDGDNAMLSLAHKKHFQYFT